MLLVIANAPKDPLAQTQGAQLAGLPPADFSRRLAGTMPRVLLAAAPADQIGSLVDGFESLGFAAFSCDPAAAPSDDDRLLVRGIEVETGALAFLDGQGTPHRCVAAALSLIQRGVRVTTTSETVTTNERRLDMGKAVLTGGLMLTSKVQKQSVRTEETREPFLLLQRNDGQPDAIIYERRVDYRFLGADKRVFLGPVARQKVPDPSGRQPNQGADPERPSPSVVHENVSDQRRSHSGSGADPCEDPAVSHAAFL